LRGFGDSSYNKNCSYLKDWAEDLLDFCKIKAIKQCVAIGWSFGGAIALKLAEVAPELVSKVVLTCSVSYLGIKLLDSN
jgi:pimeloyl-ACP methyl ester carboxylesterase